jgi:hypothetical protein
MRWDNLFDDLESQLEQELRAEEVDLAAEEERLRIGRLSIRDRLLALSATAGEASITVVLRDGSRIRLAPSTVGRDWVSGDLGEGRRDLGQVIVPFSALAGLLVATSQLPGSLGRDTPQRGPGISDRIGVTFVLRDLARRRSGVSITTLQGTESGTIDRVGRDHLDLAVHDRDVPRREGNVTGSRIVLLDQVLAIRL